MIKFPYRQITKENSFAVYCCVNKGEAVCPKDIEEQSICIDGDIGAVQEDSKGQFIDRYSPIYE